MRLYLIRHPRPLVEDGICYGSTDLSVSAEAIGQALAALPDLPSGLRCFSSPLRRCHDFALVLAQARGLTRPIADARLVEMHFGSWEMRSWSSVRHDEVDAWAADLVGYSPGGGESVLKAALRVRDFLRELQSGGEDAVVVCHAGTIRLLRACCNHNDLAAAALHAASREQAVPYGGLTVLDM